MDVSQYLIWLGVHCLILCLVSEKNKFGSQLPKKLTSECSVHRWIDGCSIIFDLTWFSLLNSLFGVWNVKFDSPLSTRTVADGNWGLFGLVWCRFGKERRLVLLVIRLFSTTTANRTNQHCYCWWIWWFKWEYVFSTASPPPPTGQ